eukprot:m51a1_g6524 hypothetical protein (563) ;mRNA; f:304043-305944
MFVWEGVRPVREVSGHRFDLSRQVLALRTESDGPNAPVQPLSALLPQQQQQQQQQAFVSGAVVAHKAKQFDDGLYAAVEVAVQRSGQRAKRGILAAVADALEAACPRAAAVADVARQLGGGPAVRESLRAAAAPMLERWEKASEEKGKPLGFYTWSAELEQVFRQDRFLQQDLVEPAELGLSVDEATALHTFVNSTPAVRAAVAKHLELPARMTNPFHAPSILEPLQLGGDKRTRLFPASESPESTLTERLVNAGVQVCDIDLMAEVVKRVRSGELRLEPTERSGWYDHCLWALQPLLEPQRTPEAAKLELSDDYVECLEGVFKALLATTRETHVKQLHIPVPRSMCMQPRNTLLLFPSLSVEPLAEYYRRRSQSYQFILDVLRNYFSGEELSSMHRLRQTGAVETPLVAEIEEMIQLFQGLHDVAMHELGFPRPSSDCSGAAEAHARKWLAGVGADADLLVDNRMMVPVFHDPQRRLHKVWCVVGFATRRLQVTYVEEPELIASEGAAGVRVSAKKDVYQYQYPVFIEAQTRKLLNRAEFQALCNQHSHPEDIKKALAALQ